MTPKFHEQAFEFLLKLKTELWSSTEDTEKLVNISKLVAQSSFRQSVK